MNKYFDFNRFSRYFAYDLHNLRANYGLSLLILGCIPVVLYLITVFFNLLTHGLFGAWQGWVSPPFAARVSLFFVALMILVISFPIKQYGALTEKRYGSDWLMIPASRLEKFTSMMVVSLVVVPLAFMVLFNLTDWLLSIFDPTYGTAIVSVRLNEIMYGAGAAMNFDDFSMPVALGANGLWILWSFIIEGMLIFLLGALCFKRKKAPMTILCLFALSMIFSVVLSLVVYHFSGNIETWAETIDPERLQNMNWNFRINFLMWMRLVVILGGLGVAIWFRLKTLKH